MKRMITAVTLLSAALMIGCSSAPKTDARFAEVSTQSVQSNTTPEKALAQLMQGNSRFIQGDSREDDFQSQVKATGAGQFPIATVLSCIDSRTPPELIFDAALGEMFSPRIAGNFVNSDILGSMEFASKVAGSKLIMVLGHTSCGAVKGACDDAKLGNLTSLIAQLKPALADTASIGADRSSKNTAFVAAVAAQNVRMTVANIRKNSAVLQEMEAKGEIKIVGAMYDVQTGVVSLL